MKRGDPLIDADRAPWLRALHDELVGRIAAPRPGMVLACSALKAKYRTAGLVADRVTARQGHFMQPLLIQSQLDTLEPLNASDWPCLACDVGAEAAPDDIVVCRRSV
ncbi:hypothetical protein T492DRAFT_1078174, partial [Pavlovales sp. CCMP2436]